MYGYGASSNPTHLAHYCKCGRYVQHTRDFPSSTPGLSENRLPPNLLIYHHCPLHFFGGGAGGGVNAPWLDRPKQQLSPGLWTVARHQTFRQSRRAHLLPNLPRLVTGHVATPWVIFRPSKTAGVWHWQFTTLVWRLGTLAKTSWCWLKVIQPTLW